MMFDIKLILHVALLTMAAIGVIFVNKKFNLKPDNPVEQIVEQEIKNETGISIDLSPEDDVKK